MTACYHISWSLLNFTLMSVCSVYRVGFDIHNKKGDTDITSYTLTHTHTHSLVNCYILPGNTGRPLLKRGGSVLRGLTWHKD